MPYIKVRVHFLMRSDKKFSNILEKMRKKKNIFIDYLNGYVDHVHCLVSLNAEQTLKQVMQLIKGESSHWINKNNLCKQKFQWQDDYFTVSVRESVAGKVRNYLKNQVQHHRRISFDGEFKKFLQRAGFQRAMD